MAKLDLIPDLQVLVVQGAMFGLAALVIKNKFVTPYLKLVERREKMTIGGSDEAAAILKRCEEKSQELSSATEQAISAAQAFRASSKEEANKEQKQIVKKAEVSANETVEKITTQIEAEYQAEHNKLASVVKGLTDEFYKLTVN